MIILYDLGLILVAIILQTTLAEFVSDLMGAKPDLVLILVVSFGLLRGKRAGTGYGWLLGLFQDGLSGSLLGQNALSKGLIGFLAGHLRRSLGDFTALTQLLFVPLATLFDAAIHVGTATLLYGTPAGKGALGTLGLAVLLNTGIAPVVSWMVRAGLRRVEGAWENPPAGKPR